jgi:hypothetical protein
MMNGMSMHFKMVMVVGCRLGKVQFRPVFPEFCPKMNTKWALGSADSVNVNANLNECIQSIQFGFGSHSNSSRAQHHGGDNK